jgi:hypothetical protein
MLVRARHDTRSRAVGTARIGDSVTNQQQSVALTSPGALQTHLWHALSRTPTDSGIATSVSCKWPAVHEAVEISV